MVKNTTGGNKAKGYARKTFTKTANVLRVSQDEAEIYAQVTKVLGGPMCHVVDLEDTQMLCHIRGKFRGRGKRDNFIETGSWVLVGMREWEKEPTKGKLLNCDMLEVYNDFDKERLKNTVTTIDWNNFISNDNKKFLSSSSLEKEDNDFVFSSEKTEEYEAIIAMQLDEQKDGTKVTTIVLDEEEIDVDDI
jgi:translation initiation factor IF-1